MGLLVRYIKASFLSHENIFGVTMVKFCAEIKEFIL